MALCSAVVEEGLAAADPWRGFCLVIERLMEVHALDRGFVPRLHLTAPPASTSPRTATGRCACCSNSSGVRRRPAACGRDFVLEDLILALMANEGIRAESPELRVAASRRFAALMIQSFQADPAPAPLPPAVRLLPTLQ